MNAGNENASVVGAEMLMNYGNSRQKKDDAISIKSISQKSGSDHDRIVVDIGGKSSSITPASSVSGDSTPIKRIKKSKHTSKHHRAPSSPSSSSVSGSAMTDDDASSVTSDSSSFTSSSDASDGKRLSQEDIMNMKRELLYQFDRMERKGVKVPKKFTLASSLEEMQCEYERMKHDRETELSIKFQRKMLMAIITGVEFLNNRFDPFDLHLDGWSESIHDNLNEYDEVFEELYAKYRGKAKMAPELKLMFMLGGSGFMFHLNNTMFRSQMPGIEQMMRQNPDMAAQMPQHQQRPQGGMGMGLGGLMGSMLGGGGGGGLLSGLFGGFGGAGGAGHHPMPMAPPQPATAANGPRPSMRGPTNVDDILNEVNNMPHHMPPQDRVETMSTISDGDLSDLPDDASMSGVFATRVRKSRGSTLNI